MTRKRPRRASDTGATSEIDDGIGLRFAPAGYANNLRDRQEMQWPVERGEGGAFSSAFERGAGSELVPTFHVAG